MTVERGQTARRITWGLVAGAAVGTAATLAALSVVLRDPTPALTPEIFRAEQALAKVAVPSDYDITIRVVGMQAATYRVEVRRGLAQTAWRNGHPLTSRRTFGTWSVPGMFSTISRDIEALERRGAGRIDESTPELTLRARFDPRFHYPARYFRSERAIDVEWEVTEFTPR
ncbi:MAG: hypothetical protein SFU86_16130 [Pirellulaceae bacterium]|nr:hypothetical protein [Pirellulaceae bacterium]